MRPRSAGRGAGKYTIKSNRREEARGLSEDGVRLTRFLQFGQEGLPLTRVGRVGMFFYNLPNKVS
jgi:hypothetical protein